MSGDILQPNREKNHPTLENFSDEQFSEVGCKLRRIINVR